MNLLNWRDLEEGPKGFLVLCSIGIPLLVIYRWTDSNLGLALPLTAAFWFSVRWLWMTALKRHEDKVLQWSEQDERNQQQARAWRSEAPD